MRFCGNCGAPLNASVINTGRCVACGARVTFSGDLIETDTSPRTVAILSPAGAAAAGDEAEGAARSAPPGVAAPTEPDVARPAVAAWGSWDRGRGTRALALGIVAAAVIIALSVVGAALVYISHNPTSGALGGIGAGAAPHATVTATAHPGATASPGSATPTTVLTAQPAPSQTVGNSAPVLAVSPATINGAPCGVTQAASLTVANTGGGSLTWSYHPPLDDLYTLSPSYGTLGAGQSQTVTVGAIAHAGTISISALGVANSPQTVMVSCG